MTVTEALALSIAVNRLALAMPTQAIIDDALEALHTSVSAFPVDVDNVTLAHFMLTEATAMVKGAERVCAYIATVRGTAPTTPTNTTQEP